MERLGLLNQTLPIPAIIQYLKLIGSDTVYYIPFIIARRFISLQCIIHRWVNVIY